LEKKLKGKYNKLFEYDESKDEYIRVSDEIENAVTTMANTRIKAEDIPHITATITITKATLSVAQRFLWNLAEQGVMKKFEFDELAAATTSKGTIRVNEFDAILWIITQSLKLLSAQPEERTKPLALYVVQFFPSHLDELRKHENFKSLELDEKREIGEGVYSYISDSDILEKFWTANGPPDSNWIDQADDITTMWQWLDDEEATRALGKRDKLWLKSIKQDPNPNRSLLRPIVKMIAKHWLLDRAWEVNLPFEWVRAFLQMVSHSADWIEEKRTDLVQDLQKKPQAEEIQEHEAEKEAEKVEVAESVKESEPVEPVSSLPEVKAVEAVEAVEETEEAKEVAKPGNETELAVEEPKTDTVTAEDDNISFIGFFETDTVAAAAKWVQRLYKVFTLDSLWYERLGETYISLYQFDLAIEALTQATKLENPHWNCFRRLAEALSSLGQQQDYPRVIECMDTVLDRLRKIREIQENKEEVTKNLIEALKQRARWQNGEDKVTTQACYQEVLALDPDDMDANYEILKNYLQTGQEESFGTHLNALSNRSPQESELSTLGRLLMHSVGYENGTDISIFDMIFRATQKSPLFDLLLDNMEDAITVARKENTVHELAALLLQIGIALYHFDQRGQKNPDSALVFWSECGSLNSGNSSWTIRPVCQKAFRLTSFHYFHKAKASTDPSSHLEKMKQVLSRQNIIDLYSKAYLGSYYALYGEDPGEAKKLYLDDFMTGLSLLSDEYEWNDYQGYLYLADILMHSGDYLNSLSAWSLIIPGDIDLAAIFLDDWKIEPQSTIAQGLKHMIPNNEVQSGST
jgi:tetratricopeptide (TPR) repeat protein